MPLALIHVCLLTHPGVYDGSHVQTSEFVWESAPSYYHDTAALPGDPLSCCGTELLGDRDNADDPYICSCDLTSGSCDVGCCCDPDCISTVDRVAVFGCVGNVSAYGRAGVKMCSDNLVDVNLPESAKADGWETDTDVDGALCVVYDNSASRGAFYDDPVDDGPLSKREVTEEIIANSQIMYSTWFGAQMAVPSRPSYKLRADTLLGDGCNVAGTAVGCTSLANVLLPVVNTEGVCVSSQGLPFLAELPPYACKPHVSLTLAEVCETGMYNAEFLAHTKFAAAPSAAALLISPALRVRRRGQGQTSGAGAFESVGSVSSSSYNSATGECIDALLVLQYRVVVDGRLGTIVAVTAYLETGRINTTVKGSYAVSYEFIAEGTESRDLSGRPGYQHGHHVLVADGAPPLFELRSSPLQLLPRTLNGECGGPDDRGTPLLFGEEVATSCSFKFETAEQMENWCTPTPAAELPLLAALNLSWTSNEAVVHVGAFGDSHPATGTSTDWVQMRMILPSSGLERKWDAATQSCTHVLAGVHAQILYAEVGSTNHPAKKIVGAQLVLTSQDVRVARGSFGQGTPTYATVSASSSFVDLPTRAYDYIPPAPTIIPRLPSDLFYPFLIDENDEAVDAQDAVGSSAAMEPLTRRRRLAADLLSNEGPPNKSNTIFVNVCAVVLAATFVGGYVWQKRA